jgi:hypothetical protein
MGAVMRVFDHIKGAGTPSQTSIFSVGPPDANIPPGIASLLRRHEIEVRPGTRFDLASLDAYLSARKTKLVDRMIIKSSLAQIGCLK